jgi:hypothetical protein
MISRVGGVAEQAALGVGPQAHAEGALTRAYGQYAHAEGNATTAATLTAHAEGNSTTVNANYAHAEGFGTTASGSYSHAQGRLTVADKVAQHTHSGVAPSTINAAKAQYSVYTVCGQVAAAAGSVVDLVFTGDGGSTVTGAGISVLLIPLKSVVAVRYDVVARPNANPATGPFGAGWSGTVLAGRGNNTSYGASYSTGALQRASGAVAATPLVSFADGTSTGLSLQYQIINSDPNNSFLSFRITNNSGLAHTMAGTLQCVELVTTT